MGSVSSISRPEHVAVIHTRSGEAEPSMFDEIRDPELRTAVEAAYEGWARKYPHLVEDWPE